MNSDIKNAVEDIDQDLWKCILLDMSSNKDKARAIELQQEIDKYEQGIKKKRTIAKSEENPNDMLITPEMSGKIVLSVLQKGKGRISHISAEIEECGIQPPTNVDTMKWKEVAELLQIDECKRLVELELAQDIGH